MTESPAEATADGAPPPNTRVEPPALVPILAEDYGLVGPLTCSWIRRGFNDHYLVEAPSGKWVLRLYFNHKYWIAGPGDFLYELELLRSVRGRGVSVAAPVARRDDGLLGTVQTEAGTRHCALFEFAEGAIRGALTPAQGRMVGRTLAEFHRAADEFRPSRPEYRRYDMDLRYLLEQPIELVGQFLAEHGRPGVGRFADGFAELRENVQALPRDGGRYGVIHGDPHRGNVAVTEDGRATLFDFDHGGFGWRGYDLAVCMGSGEPQDRAPRIEGYESVRPITALERELLPVFRKLNAIWDLGDVLAMRAAWGTDEEIGATFAERAEERLGRLFGDVGSGRPRTQSP